MATAEKGKQKYFEGLGRRKNAVARVRVMPAAKPQFLVNDQSFDQYFKNPAAAYAVKRILAESGLNETMAISVRVRGGGRSGQAGAVSHGLARALVLWKPDLRSVLKKGKFLTRDSRVKERRKFGLKKARKAPQWSKR